MEHIQGVRLRNEPTLDLFPPFRSGGSMIIVGSGLAAPRPPSAHLVPLDRPAAAGRVVKFGQRLERSLLADPPASGLDELENSHGPALIPTT